MARRRRRNKLVLPSGQRVRKRRGFNIFRALANPLHRIQSATGLSRRTRTTRTLPSKAGVAGGGGAPLGEVVKTWNAGEQEFFMDSTGRIATQKKNGVWKSWKPKKHVVVSSNPRLGTLLRASGRIDTYMKNLAKRMPKTRTRTIRQSSPAAPSQLIRQG